MFPVGGGRSTPAADVGFIALYDAFVVAKYLAWKHTFEHLWDLSHPQTVGYSHFLILRTNMKWETHCSSPAAVYSRLRWLYSIHLFAHCSPWDSIGKRGAHASALQHLCAILLILYLCPLMVFVFFTLCPPSNRIYTLKHWQMIW